MIDPSPIKPALYAYDQYQTYDLLWAEGIDPRIVNLIANKLGQHYLFDSGLGAMPVCLIERFTPDASPWAYRWSSRNVNFLKELSRTHLMTNEYATGEHWNFPSQYTFTSDPNINLGEFPNTITLTLAPNSQTSLSWLEHAHTEGWAMPIHPKYTQPCLIFNKRSRVLRSGDESRTVSLSTANWLINSLVVSDSTNATFSEDVSLILYDNLFDTLDLLLSQLNLMEGQILTGLTVSHSVRLKLGHIDEDPGFGPEEYYHNCKTYFLDPIYGNPRYKSIPNWYFFVSLIYANNNYWGNGVIYEDAGKPITPIWKDDVFNLSIWYLGSHTFEDFQIRKNVSIPYPSLPFSLDYAFRDDNTFDPTLKYQVAQLYAESLPRIRKSVFDTYNVERFAYTPDNMWGRIGLRIYEIEETQYSSLLHRWTGNYLLAFVSPSLISPHLIQKTKGVIFHPRLTTIGYITFYPAQGIQFPSGRQVNRDLSFANLQAEVIQRNGQIFLESSVAQINSVSQPIDIGPAGEPDLGTGVSGWLLIFGFLYDETFSQNLDLKFEFWSLAPEAVQVHTIGAIKSLVDALFTETFNPEDYIMADSIRIKEIHAALQADKFANDDSGPNTLRVANIGYYVERLARVMGISVNSDGSVRSIRQSKHIKPGESIPPGWPIAQWGRNQGGSSQGQTGGNADEDRDGLAYEVRSNAFDVDPFKGTPSKINSGGYVLVENWPQMMHIILDDLDKGLGWQESGANVIPSINNGEPVPYEGQNSLMVEIAYMLSQLSRNIIGGHISSLVTQAIAYEILTGLGLPITLKEFGLNVGGEEDARMGYPGLDDKSPTVLDLIFLVLMNLSPLLAAKLTLTPEPKEEKT